MKDQDFPGVEKGTYTQNRLRVVESTGGVLLIEFKYCEDTRPQNQQRKAEEQHTVLIDRLRRQDYMKVKLHVILAGAMGTLYTIKQLMSL